MPTDTLDAMPLPFSGRLVRAGDPGYEESRKIFNGSIDRCPALIAYCSTRDDVAACLALARDTGLEVAVRAGGHSVAGHSVCEGGLVIDLSGLQDIAVDTDARTVRAGGGLTWRAFDAATQQVGLATTGGRVTSTGVGGLTLGSGSGWLERSLGFTCENLLGAEMVTASGEVVRASENLNADLFWGSEEGAATSGS